MPTDTFIALVARYVDAFGELPADAIHHDDATLEELMREALDQRRPIPEDDYERGLPDGADA